MWIVVSTQKTDFYYLHHPQWAMQQKWYNIFIIAEANSLVFDAG